MEQPALNFSGDNDSWFDLWHIHTDFEGEGNTDFVTRRTSLDKLLQEYKRYKCELEKYPHPYQIFMIIDENDSSEDAVYIHTKNPNSDNFPLKIEAGKDWTCTNKQLAEFMKQTNFYIVEATHSESKFYYLFECDTGVSLI
ncbi:hypothetical protein [Paenimyroides baculatum]|uniref:Uncharacterized protein n=1 Tax=Paenimyroides baculatum TaxID=2608000 RepID=A0A5M6C9G9_9FLAO|nr:hypothetical protein [Paenimyroides baculatum]KAA5531798.1 hypothetical protein F0460_14995 [Paenimyroides baculatum]